MKYRTRTYYTDAQKALMWARWKEGWTLHQIAQLFNRAHTSVQGILARTGGIRPPARSRCATALTLTEREEISRAMVDGQSIRSVAARLGRAPSTVSREIKRNGGQLDYRATEADRAAWDRALRPKHCKLVENMALAHIVTDKLRLLWSPEQIAGWLKHTYPRDESQHVSHETIYRSLFIQARGALKKELLQHLRRTRGMRRSRHHTQKTDIHGQIVGAVSISERPASAEDRAVPGHWEGDLLFGSHNSQIATLVERQTRYVMLVNKSLAASWVCAPTFREAPKKVEYISPITGNFAIAGQEMVDGWDLYWEINGTEVGGVTVEFSTGPMPLAGVVVSSALSLP